MSKDAHSTTRRRAARISAAMLVSATTFLTAACSNSGGSGGASTQKVELTFSQWWAPEMPSGALQRVIDEFHTANPLISVKLISAPFASLQTQTISQAASGTLPDVVGLDGSWVNPLYKQGALLNLSEVMKTANYDPKNLASQVGFNGSTYMIPVVNFVYPLFTNDEILAKAGISKPPSTWSEFESAAKKISQTVDGVKGWIAPLGTTNPNGAQNDILSWAWASGGSMLKDGKPALTGNEEVRGAVNLVKNLVESDSVVAGAANLQEIDKVQNFINGRVGMMVDSLAHVTTIVKGNPGLKFSVSTQPAVDGYSGKHGIVTASWGIGVSAKSKHPTESWKLVQFLMDKNANSTLATLANGFPGNTTAVPDFTGADPHFKQAFDIYTQSKPVNEFTGLPSANQLMTDFLNEFQKTTTGKSDVETMLSQTQKKWEQQF
ncbi:MAG: sugar ABC transporter substrate-binding protein [Candidatus Lumbricidophila eiseniae]|uniref:Sugar ABC transporter substrate-binding protein n=1 Tax=Candidatus Lumbricidiphila eiseniae TaxID=1969409 RepID=A0A2A6FPB4_9MICO|nr:MAG: sugar ABC transporter substrate-binding protein [Candidatus Lumbricidophila eiseniae]